MFDIATKSGDNFERFVFNYIMMGGNNAEKLMSDVALLQRYVKVQLKILPLRGQAKTF